MGKINHPWTDAEIDTLEAGRMAGDSVAVLAQRLQRPLGSVWWKLKELGITKPRIASLETLGAVLGPHRAADAARQLGISENTLRCRKCRLRQGGIDIGETVPDPQRKSALCAIAGRKSGLIRQGETVKANDPDCTVNPNVLRGNTLRILGLIVEGRRTGIPPTMRDLCAATGIASTNGINGHLQRLIKMGLITKDNFRGRTLRATCTVEVCS